MGKITQTMWGIVTSLPEIMSEITISLLESVHVMTLLRIAQKRMRVINRLAVVLLALTY